MSWIDFNKMNQIISSAETNNNKTMSDIKNLEDELLEFSAWLIRQNEYEVHGGMWYNPSNIIDLNEGITLKQLFRVWKILKETK